MTRRYVLDTSVVVKWFSQEKGSDKAEEWLKALEKKEIEILLPILAKYELANAFLKGKKLYCQQAKEAMGVFYRLPLIFMEETLDLACLSYFLAEKLKITYYDACFLALAKAERVALITANPKHQKKISGIKITSL